MDIRKPIRIDALIRLLRRFPVNARVVEMDGLLTVLVVEDKQMRQYDADAPSSALPWLPADYDERYSD